jgi:hypothetical protein
MIIIPNQPINFDICKEFKTVIRNNADLVQLALVDALRSRNSLLQQETPNSIMGKII